jgi:hypothetical protein
LPTPRCPAFPVISLDGLNFGRRIITLCLSIHSLSLLSLQADITALSHLLRSDLSFLDNQPAIAQRSFAVRTDKHSAPSELTPHTVSASYVSQTAASVIRLLQVAISSASHCTLISATSGPAGVRNTLLPWTPQRNSLSRRHAHRTLLRKDQSGRS